MEGIDFKEYNEANFKEAGYCVQVNDVQDLHGFHYNSVDIYKDGEPYFVLGRHGSGVDTVEKLIVVAERIAYLMWFHGESAEPFVASP